MTVELSAEEARYLLGQLKLAREYYAILAGSSKAQEGNLQKYRLVESIGKKLEVMVSSSGVPVLSSK